jgi:hypothetical protein
MANAPETAAVGADGVLDLPRASVFETNRDMTMPQRR